MQYIRSVLKLAGMLAIMAAAALMLTVASLELFRRLPSPGHA